MRITIVCNDTRGGVQPYVALALGLTARGHEVRAVAPSDLAAMFSRASVATTALEGSIEEVLRGSGGAAERGSLASIRLAARELPRRLGRWTAQALEACEGSDLVTGGIGGMVSRSRSRRSSACPSSRPTSSPSGRRPTPTPA